MKILKFVRKHDLSQLHDELIAAIPSLAPVFPESPDPDLPAAMIPVIGVYGRRSTIWISVPDDTDPEPVASLVAAHTPSTAPANENVSRLTRIEELLAAGKTNWTAADRDELIELTAIQMTR